MFVLFFFIPYFHPLFSCFSSGLVEIEDVPQVSCLGKFITFSAKQVSN
ncbi:hypothetical protein IYZ83_005905 [Wolbachia pipientis]|nr:hypothetical protein [Wolbachia pipientis]UIP91647.1 hypothetical protein IYZ83_005905 [Wolbachia pipientis]